MNYLPKNRSSRLYFKQILILITVFLSGAFIFYFFDAVVLSLVSPIWKAEHIVLRNWRQGVSLFDSRWALVAENVALKERLSALEFEILSLSGVRAQEQTLMALFGRRRVANTIIATVLTYPPQTPYDIIIIDAGVKDSLTLGAEVSLPEGPILGKISEVFARQSRVTLFSTASEETNAVLERNNVPVTLVGAGAGNFRMMIPRAVAVEKGDRILSADITARLLAVVGEVSMGSTDSFKEVLANSPINILAIRFVFVTP